MPYSAIQKALKSTDRVTLYRTLQTLSDKGIIHKAAHIDNEDYYAICEHSCTADEHIHTMFILNVMIVIPLHVKTSKKN